MLGTPKTGEIWDESIENQLFAIMIKIMFYVIVVKEISTTMIAASWGLGVLHDKGSLDGASHNND